MPSASVIVRVTGGGAKFQLGSKVTEADKASLGIRNFLFMTGDKPDERLELIVIQHLYLRLEDDRLIFFFDAE